MKCLILGDGQLGTELWKQTGWDYISRKKDGIEFTRITSYAKFLQPYNVIINCIAHTNTIHNEKEPHWSINYKGVIDLVDMCNVSHKKLVQISTDYIYANSPSEASEMDVPIHLGNWYTYTKLLSDGYVQAASSNYLLVRTSFRPRPFPFPKAWVDHLTNADYEDVITALIIKLIEQEEERVFNVGTEVKTLLELAKETVPDCKPMMDDHRYLRPQDVTMSLNKLKRYTK